MPDSNRSVRVAVVGAIAALSITALGTGAFFGALYAPHYGYQTTHAADRAAQAEKGYPSQIGRDRAGLPYFAERIASGPDPEDSAEREQRDLAAQESMSVWAFWLLLVTAAGTATTMTGTGLLLWQIILTRRAVEDTGEATEAMRKANKIALDSQRAWITLKAVPQLARTSGIGGLYLRLEIHAKNTGASAATHFEMNTRVYFIGPSGKSKDLAESMSSQIETWKAEYVAGEVSVLMPSDGEVDSIWDTFEAEEVHWREPLPRVKVCYPMVLAAVFYRTASAPDTVQLSWRSWFIHSFGDDGEVVSWVPQPPFKGLSRKDLCAEPHRMNLTHEEYPADDAEQHRTGEPI